MNKLKHLCTMLLAVALCVNFASCGSDDADEPTPTPMPEGVNWGWTDSNHRNTDIGTAKIMKGVTEDFLLTNLTTEEDVIVESLTAKYDTEKLEVEAVSSKVSTFILVKGKQVCKTKIELTYVIEGKTYTNVMPVEVLPDPDEPLYPNGITDEGDELIFCWKENTEKGYYVWQEMHFRFNGSSDDAETISYDYVCKGTDPNYQEYYTESHSTKFEQEEVKTKGAVREMLEFHLDAINALGFLNCIIYG